MYYFVNNKNTVSFAHVPCDFILLYLIVLTFAVRLKSANYKSHWNILVFYNQWKKVRFEYHPLKMSHFVFLPLLGFTLVIKLRNFDFESPWNAFIFFDKKKYMLSDLNMSHGKISDFVWLSLFGFTLVTKLRNLYFKGH